MSTVDALVRSEYKTRWVDVVLTKKPEASVHELSKKKPFESNGHTVLVLRDGW